MYEVGKGRKSYRPGNTAEKQMWRFISYLSQIQTPVRICLVLLALPLSDLPVQSSGRTSERNGIKSQKPAACSGNKAAFTGVGACFVVVLLSSCALHLSKACIFPQRMTAHFHFGVRSSGVLIIQHLVNIEECFWRGSLEQCWYLTHLH